MLALDVCQCSSVLNMVKVFVWSFLRYHIVKSFLPNLAGCEDAAGETGGAGGRSVGIKEKTRNGNKGIVFPYIDALNK